MPRSSWAGARGRSCCGRSESVVVVVLCVCVSVVSMGPHTLLPTTPSHQTPTPPHPTSPPQPTNKQPKNRYIAPESRTAYVDALFEALFVMPDKGTEIVAADVLVRWWCFSFSFIVCVWGWDGGWIDRSHCPRRRSGRSLLLSTPPPNLTNQQQTNYKPN